jgi:hypothetical protein
MSGIIMSLHSSHPLSLSLSLYTLYIPSLSLSLLPRSLHIILSLSLSFSLLFSLTLYILHLSLSTLPLSLFSSSLSTHTPLSLFLRPSLSIPPFSLPSLSLYLTYSLFLLVSHIMSPFFHFDTLSFYNLYLNSNHAYS